MSNFEDNRNDEYEYYEDTHNAYGEYTGKMLDYIRAQQEREQSENLPTIKEQEIKVYRDQVPTIDPKKIEDAQALIDQIRDNQPVMINLDECDVEVAQRVLDFVSGATYALGGSVRRVSGNLFLAVPKNVTVIQEV